MPIQRALLSVYDKTGIEEFARGLLRLGVQEIISSGGTAKLLQSKGILVTEVADYTGFPECFDGRLKTLHPRIHGGILQIRSNVEHTEQAKGLKIPPIDLVAVNLYPFDATVKKLGQGKAGYDDVIENIDIGGSSLLRGGAKNFASVTVISDPADYEEVLQEMRENNGDTTLRTRNHFAAKVFSITSFYDARIALFHASYKPKGLK